jgi:hypothetical protein
VCLALLRTLSDRLDVDDIIPETEASAGLGPGKWHFFVLRVCSLQTRSGHLDVRPLMTTVTEPPRKSALAASPSPAPSTGNIRRRVAWSAAMTGLGGLLYGRDTATITGALRHRCDPGRTAVRGRCRRGHLSIGQRLEP